VKKLALSLMCLATVAHAEITVTLDKTFLKIPGKYLFSLDLEGRKQNKKWEVQVTDGKATIKDVGGLPLIKLSLKDNVIKVKTPAKGKEADELAILTKYSTVFPIGSTAEMGMQKSGKNFTVAIGEGLGIYLAAADKTKVGQACHYTITGAELPNGKYTLKLIIPAKKDYKYTFEVQNGVIAKILEASNKNITLEKELSYLKINAEEMCRVQRLKQAALGLGVGLPAAFITATAIINSPAILDKLSVVLFKISENTGSAIHAITFQGSYVVMDAATTIATHPTATYLAASAAGTAAGAAGSPAGLALGKREATMQITYDSGDWTGDKAAKFDYAECSNNIFLLYRSPQKINITGK
jgi:hypothetical protein